MIKKQGFTLLELIAVLLLTAVLVLTGVHLLSNVMLGYITARQTYQSTQKAHAALDRIVLELSEIAENGTLTSISSTKVQYEDKNNNVYDIHLEGKNVYFHINGSDYVLLDDVIEKNGLKFSYYNSYTASSTTTSVQDVRLIGIDLTFFVGQNQSKTLSAQVAKGRE